MTKILAIVELTDASIDPMEPTNLISISPVHDFPMDAVPDGNALVAHWNAGIQARHHIEAVAENFYQLFRKSGIVDENGLHIKEYTAGSVFRFMAKNQETMFPESFQASALGMLIATTFKSGAKMMGKKGKDIDMDWSFVIEHGGPMMDTVIRQIMLSPDRRVIVEPLLRELLESKHTLPTLQARTNGE